MKFSMRVKVVSLLAAFLFMAAGLLFSCPVASAFSEHSAYYEFEIVITLERDGIAPLPPAHPMDGNWKIKTATAKGQNEGVPVSGTYKPGSASEAVFPLEVLGPDADNLYLFVFNGGVDVEFEYDAIIGGVPAVDPVDEELGNKENMTQVIAGKEYYLSGTDSEKDFTIRITINDAGDELVITETKKKGAPPSDDGGGGCNVGLGLFAFLGAALLFLRRK